MVSIIVSVIALSLWLGLQLFCAYEYKKIHGRALKWRAFWMAHGALLWAIRLPKYEKK